MDEAPADPAAITAALGPGGRIITGIGGAGVVIRRPWLRARSIVVADDFDIGWYADGLGAVVHIDRRTSPVL